MNSFFLMSLRARILEGHARALDSITHGEPHQGECRVKTCRFTRFVVERTDTMKFQVEEIGRVYGVHPYYLGQTSGSGSQGAISDVMLYHQVVTMAPWIERWEAALRRSVLRDTGVRANFDENVLMRTTPQVRAEIYARALGSGGNNPWMTEDEVREGKSPFNLNAKGDEYWQNQGAGNEAKPKIPTA